MKYLLLAIVLVATSCHVSINSGDTVNGNGVIKKEARNVTGFSGIDVAGPFNVVLVQGSTYSIEVEGDENLLPHIQIQKSEGNLDISEEDGFDLRSRNGITVRIQLPDVNELSVSGSGSIKSETLINNSKSISISIAGSGDVDVEVKTPATEVEIGGSGKATLSGSTRKLDIGIGGSGDCLAEDLLSEDCDVSIGGSGTARVFASVSLKGSIGGSGNIYYRGEPKNLTKSIGGSGSIEAVK